MKGVVSKETVVLCRWGSSKQKFGFINGVDNVLDNVWSIYIINSVDETKFLHPNISGASFFAPFLWLDAATRPYYINYSFNTVNAFRVQVENGLENVFFLLFSLFSIQFDIS